MFSGYQIKIIEVENKIRYEINYRSRKLNLKIIKKFDQSKIQKTLSISNMIIIIK